MRGLQRVCFLVALVGACSFSGRTSGDPKPGDDMPSGPDAGVEPDPVARCNTPDEKGLVLCLEFEDGASDNEILDSSLARRRIVTDGLSDFERTGTPSSTAVHVGGDSTTYVAQEPALELGGAYTLAAWVFPDSMPALGTVGGIFDHENQYAMYVRGGARARMEHRCAQQNASGEWTAELPEDAWSFIACTWDGTNQCAYRWSGDGDHEKWCVAMPALAAAGAEGLAIGHLSHQGVPHSRFDGKLDSLQVYQRTLDVTQLCALIGRGADCM